MMAPADPLEWAKHPRSREAIAAVQNLAGRDRRFRTIWDKLVRDGVVSDSGTPLAVWDGGRWRTLAHG